MPWEERPDTCLKVSTLFHAFFQGLCPPLDFLSKNNRNRPQIVAGFSAETKSVIKNSIQKMKNKNCDIIFANDVSKKNIGFNSEFNKVSMIDQKGNIKIIPKNKKSFIDHKIAQILLNKLIDDRNIN